LFDEFRQIVKRLAKEKGYTYAKMAGIAGIDESTIKCFMCGANDSRRIAEKLADVLGVGILYKDGEFLVAEETED
jgi:transcriptional regulator with XRE-family HTH domain